MMFTFSNFQFIQDCRKQGYLKNQFFLLLHTACVSLVLPLSPFPWTHDTHVVCLQWNVSQCVQIWILNISNTDSFTQTIHIWYKKQITVWIQSCLGPLCPPETCHAGLMQESLQHPHQRYVIGRNRWEEEILVLHQRPENRQVRCSPLKKDGITYSDSATKSDLLNRQLASVFSNEAPGDLPDLGPSNTPDVPRITVSTPGVVKLLKDLNPNKATGPDSIPGKLLKEAATELAPVLTFQTSIDQGRIPDDWKSAKITPVYKKGDRSQPSNYRPNSLTSICYEVIEHIIHSSVISHLENYHILSDYQHGLRKRRSTETQLILTIQDLVHNINAGEQTDAILLDFLKAFDDSSSWSYSTTEFEGAYWPGYRTSYQTAHRK